MQYFGFLPLGVSDWNETYHVFPSLLLFLSNTVNFAVYNSQIIDLNKCTYCNNKNVVIVD